MASPESTPERQEVLDLTQKVLEVLNFAALPFVYGTSLEASYESMTAYQLGCLLGEPPHPSSDSELIGYKEARLALLKLLALSMGSDEIGEALYIFETRDQEIAWPPGKIESILERLVENHAKLTE